MIWLASIGVFIGSLVLGALWALYFRFANAGRAAAAATADVALIMVGSLVVLAYTHDWRLLLADYAGTWIGTYVTIKKQKQVTKPPIV